MPTDLDTAREMKRRAAVLKHTEDAITAINQVTTQLRQVATTYVAAKANASDVESADAVKGEVLAAIDTAAATINGWGEASERSAIKTALTALLAKLT